MYKVAKQHQQSIRSAAEKQAGASWPLLKPGAGCFPGPGATFCQLALFAIPTQCVSKSLCTNAQCNSVLVKCNSGSQNITIPTQCLSKLHFIGSIQMYWWKAKHPKCVPNCTHSCWVTEPVQCNNNHFVSVSTVQWNSILMQYVTLYQARSPLNL